jgi:hypothetical protein
MLGYRSADQIGGSACVLPDPPVTLSGETDLGSILRSIGLNVSDANEIPGSRRANVGRHWATPGRVQPLSVQLNATSGHTRRRSATSGECLLSGGRKFGLGDNEPIGRAFPVLLVSR